MKKTEINKLKKLLHQLVVVRDKKCLKCGKTLRLNASHIYSKGAHPSIKWYPKNVKALCYSCHLYWFHRDPLEATKWLKEVFGIRYLNNLLKKEKELSGTKKHLDYEYNKKILEKEIKKYVS